MKYLILLFFLFTTLIVNSQSITSNKIYYFYYSIDLDRQYEQNNVPEKRIWIQTDSLNEYHEFTSYCSKKISDITKITYIGYGFIEDIIIEDGILYFKSNRFWKYIDFIQKPFWKYTE